LDPSSELLTGSIGILGDSRRGGPERATDRYDEGVHGFELVETRGNVLYLLPALPAVIVSLEQQNDRIDIAIRKRVFEPERRRTCPNVF